MEAPPYYAPRPKKSRTGVIIALVALAVFVCCGLPIILIGGGTLWALKKGGGFIGCSVSLVPMQRAAQDYAAEHDGKLPAAANWENAFRPYYKRHITKLETGQKIFKVIPTNGPWGCDEPTGTTGLAYNTQVAGKKLAEIKDPATVILFEVPKAGKNLALPYKAQDYNGSPDMMGMGKKRGWFIIPARGDVALAGKDGRIVPVSNGQSTSFD